METPGSDGSEVPMLALSRPRGRVLATVGGVEVFVCRVSFSDEFS